MAKARRDNLLQMTNEVGRARADYRMANRSNPQTRARGGVPSQGAGADYHYRNESSYLWMQEVAWDIYRNNMAVGSITDRAIENWLQDGFRYNPQTGDESLDADVKQWWEEVRNDPKECDPAWEYTFDEQTEFVARQACVAGDTFGVPLGGDEDFDGTVEIRESHTCRSPSSNNIKENVVLGIEKVPNTRRPKAFWFLKEEINPHKLQRIRKDDLQPMPAFDEDGERNVFHVRIAKRSSQSRGVSCYAPIIDPASYHDDVQYLKMVQARAASLFVFVRKRLQGFDPAYLNAELRMGRDVTAEKLKGEQYTQNAAQYREVGAGSALEGLPGEEIEPWSANIPNPEFFPHAKMLLTFMSINLGMPLVLALMDASETNFSGWRGAFEQAKMGFRSRQRSLARHWHTPYIRFKILKRAEQDPVWRKYIERTTNPRSRINIFRGRWDFPGWPYIEPMKDATAGLIRLANAQTSPRRFARENGNEWDEISQETVDDRAAHYARGVEKAKQLIKEHDLDMTVDELAIRLAPLPMPERVQISLSADMGSEPTSQQESETDAQ